jgi:hypothetical protein
MPAKAKGNRIVHDLHAIAKDIPAYLGRVYFGEYVKRYVGLQPRPAFTG